LVRISVRVSTVLKERNTRGERKNARSEHETRRDRKDSNDNIPLKKKNAKEGKVKRKLSGIRQLT
jgi:hypothetical protein